MYPSEPAAYGRPLWFEDWVDNELPKATASLFFNRIAVTCQFIQMLYAGETLPTETHPNITRYLTELMHRASFKELINNDPFMKL